MYVHLKYGDRLPTVALAQSLLVRHGFEVRVDGHFGDGTREAVLALQRRAGLDPRGVITPRTWNALSVTPNPRALRVVEQVDASDAMSSLQIAPGEVVLSRVARGELDDGHSQYHEAREGGSALFDRLVRSNPPRSVDLLRFHGHGAPGYQHLFWSTSFDAVTAERPEMRAILARLGTIMRPTGSIELHGCNVGMGARGHRLLQTMAESTRVPVSAGRPLQYEGPMSGAFEGAVVTCCPSRRSLAEWARSVFGA